MALENGWPGHTLQPTFSNIRHDQEGMVARNVAGKIRAGVLPSHTDNLVIAHADGLRVTIKDNRAVLDKDGAVFISNTGDLVWPPQGQSAIKWPDPPLANKRIDLLYMRQRSSSLGDGAGNDTPTFGVHPGTAAPIPTVPSLPPALADALVYAKVEMPAGASSMTSGPVVENVFPFTAMAGGTVVVRNLVELAAWTPADGSKAYCLADTKHYVRAGGAWQPSDPVVISPMSGSAPAGSVGFTQAGTVTVTLDTAGNGTIVFPTSFPNALVSVILMDGEHPSTAGGARIFGAFGSSANTSKSQVRFAARNDAGVALVGQVVKVAFVAVGC